MPALKNSGTHPQPNANQPYPTWAAVADHVGLHQRAVAQDHQAEKEARIWHELAVEDSADDAPRSCDPLKRQS